MVTINIISPKHKMTKRIKLKLILLGPISCGKTIIADFLGGAKENIITETRPTKAVRIVEFQEEGVKNAKNSNSKSTFAIDIELWDCSGDRRYENLWPVFIHEADGAIFVCSDDTHAQKKDLDSLYAYYQSHAPQNVQNNCLVINNQYEDSDEAEEGDRKPTKSYFKNILPKVTNRVSGNVEEAAQADELRNTFNNFIGFIANRKIEEVHPM